MTFKVGTNAKESDNPVYIHTVHTAYGSLYQGPMCNCLKDEFICTIIQRLPSQTSGYTGTIIEDIQSGEL